MQFEGIGQGRSINLQNPRNFLQSKISFNDMSEMSKSNIPLHKANMRAMKRKKESIPFIFPFLVLGVQIRRDFSHFQSLSIKGAIERLHANCRINIHIVSSC